MVKEVKNKLDEIILICKAIQLKSLCLFGSGARAKNLQTDSDLDFLFCFQTNDAGFPLSGCDYFDLLFELERLTGKKIDLVAEEKIRNRFFLESINKDKICIYEA